MYSIYIILSTALFYIIYDTISYSTTTTQLLLYILSSTTQLFIITGQRDGHMAGSRCGRGCLPPENLNPTSW